MVAVPLACTPSVPPPIPRRSLMGGITHARMGASADFGGSRVLQACRDVTMILHATLPLAVTPSAEPPRRNPAVLVSGRPRSVRIRREFPWSGAERTWMLDLEIEVPDTDPERLLAECEGFLVDEDGQTIGVVEGIERDGPFGAVSALIVAAGWFGRKQLRVDADAIESLAPLERRIIVAPEATDPPPRVLADGRS